MNRLPKDIREIQASYEKNKKRIWIAGAAILLILLLISIGFITKTVTAQRSGKRVKLITSVEIQAGDTLWSIASAYMSDEYDSINDYIDEIRDSNGMASDEIHTGNYIIVPYYADASK